MTLTRWAYGAEVGDVSEIFSVGRDYAIAMLTAIDNDEYASPEKVAAQLRAQVLRDKKYDYIVSSLAGTTPRGAGFEPRIGSCRLQAM